MSILFYKRPDYVSKEGGPMTASSCQRYVEKASGKTSIPPQLSFERIIENKTMPPCSLQDFLDYLVYVAHDAENLQFYLWLQDYKRRFFELSDAEQVLSPPSEPDTTVPNLAQPGGGSVKSSSDELLDKDVEAQYLNNLQKIASRKSAKPPPIPLKDYGPDSASTLSPALSAIVNFETSRRWNVSASQPFRAEINQIITHYLLPSSPRELNLSHKARASLLSALHRTTHPSAFAAPESLTYQTLRHHAHPNFVRWSLCNGNKPRVLLLRTLAVSWLVMFAAGTVALILSSRPRWFRIALAPLCYVGVTNLIAAAKGLCILLHRLHTRELRPWELEKRLSRDRSAGEDDRSVFAERLARGFSDNGEGKGGRPGFGGSRKDRSSEDDGEVMLCQTSDSDRTVGGLEAEDPPDRHSMEQIDLESRPRDPLNSLSLRLSPLGPGNEWESEAWVEKWAGMGWWQRVRIRKVWMKEEGLRLMQNKIVIQAELWAVIVTVLVEIGIVFCPEIGLY